MRAIEAGQHYVFRMPHRNPTASMAHHEGKRVVAVRIEDAVDGVYTLWTVRDEQGREFGAYSEELHPTDQPRQGLHDTNQGGGFWEWYLSQQEAQQGPSR